MNDGFNGCCTYQSAKKTERKKIDGTRAKAKKITSVSIFTDSSQFLDF